MASAIEQHHDKDGIQWPLAIAPYEVNLVGLGNDPESVKAGDALYAELTAAGIEVLYDDRDERPGAKFKDADLIGAPLRVAVGGRSLKEGLVEIKWRRGPEVDKVPLADAGRLAIERIKAERARLGGA
jgi:prolyl-tRNA synthetase